MDVLRFSVPAVQLLQGDTESVAVRRRQLPVAEDQHADAMNSTRLGAQRADETVEAVTDPRYLYVADLQGPVADFDECHVGFLKT